MTKTIRINRAYKPTYRLAIFFLVVLGIALIGIGIRIISYNALRHRTDRDAVISVAVIKAGPTPAIEEIILPGNVQAWHEAAIFSRTNGYVKRWETDIGSYVKAGDLLAEIQTPEVDAQLRQAGADLGAAGVNNLYAQRTANRWVNLLKTNSVSLQETDQFVSNASATLDLVKSAAATRDRFRVLVGFERIIAPFDGVITFRGIDIGSLVSDGNVNQLPLFRIAQADPLRIYVKIPQNYTTRVTRDMKVNLYFNEHPNKLYSATLLDTAEAIEPRSRTLLAQFVADNKNHELLPGGYTQVHFKFSPFKNTVRLPVNTLLFRKEGLQIATLDQHSRVVLKSIRVLRDFGNEVEVDSGVKLGETVIINPPDSLTTGQYVQIAKFKDKNKAEKK